MLHYTGDFREKVLHYTGDFLKCVYVYSTIWEVRERKEKKARAVCAPLHGR